ncbi:MAG TPA: phospholipid carrier-dependent glycosyltransferase [Thermoanaerobaculia bacterium]|nr:phospholipid carrier-dependent glycosyltransferase [Thermoanaerobaculia bacterium]
MISPRALVPPAVVTVLVAGAVFPSGVRAVQALVFLAMIAALAGTGRRTARWLVPDVGRLSRAVTGFTVAVAVASMPATGLGHFGALRPGPFLLCVAGAYLLSQLLPDRRESLGTHLTLSGAPEGSLASRIESALLLAAGAALALAFAGVAWRLRVEPPGHGPDDLSYHLSAIAVWQRFADLRMIKFAVGDWSTSFYPVLPELSAWTFLAPFADSDVLARWSQLPYALFSLVAVAAIARRLGLSRRSTAFAVIFYGSLRRVLVLSFTAGNDHVAAFFTLAALDAALAAGRHPRPGRFAATGLALGLLLASKYLGIYNAATVLAVLAVSFVARPRNWNFERSAVALPGLAGLLAAVMLFTGGYTYLRNAVTAGNPVYPAPVYLFGQEILHGEEETSVAVRRDSPEGAIDVPHFLTRRRDLFGSLFPFTLLPAAIVAPLVAFWRRKVIAGVVLALPAIFFLQFLYLMYDHRDVRYFLAGIALAAVGLAWLLDRAGTWGSSVRSLLLLVLTTQLARRLERTSWVENLVALALLLLAFVAPRARRWLAEHRGVFRRGWVPWAAGAAVVGAAVALGAGVEVYQKQKLRKRPAVLALEKAVGPAGARVAYVGLNAPYLFFGRRLENDVRIVPLTRNLDAAYYRWGGPVERPFEQGPYRRWKKNLADLDIRTVVVIRSSWEDPERRWMAKRRTQFRRIYRDWETEIWRVRPGPAAASESGEEDRPARRRGARGRGARPGAGSGSRSSAPAPSASR